MAEAQVGVTGEAVMMLFMLFALSRLTFSKDTVTATQGGLMTDPEFRMKAEALAKGALMGAGDFGFLARAMGACAWPTLGSHPIWLQAPPSLAES